ncbi:PREDICTED: glutamate receptor-interacting protein 1, partial [Nicrophorus vespilloides]|uniref:Glutamate receptor-interacting protein 1 n=1 Tax=Nicrophorus vespilloides TaxID=110193 RepID=A0ABM1MY60_NICVS
SQSSLCVTSKITEIRVERVDGSLGITLRGGNVTDHPHLSRPLVITQVRPQGPAYRTGLIRVGDRLLKVDNHNLSSKTLLDAQKILKDSSHLVYSTLTLEYDVSIMESVKYATGPLLVEIDRNCNEDLGIVLTNCACDFGTDDIIPAGVFVENIVPASTADRCGALNIGDQLLVIDDLLLDEWNGSIGEAEKMLKTATKIQILPIHAVHRTPSRNYQLGPYASSPTMSAGFSTINSKRSRILRNRTNRQSSLSKSLDDSGSYGYSMNMGVCHSENLSVTLVTERGKGYGLSIGVGEHSESRPANILIARIIPDSPAYRCGCLQNGDRIISVNHQPNLTLQEISTILEMGNEPGNTGKIALQIEFDVADSIVPASGIFTVKLAKRAPGLGITITASKSHPDEPFIISEIKRGSIAHRTGTIHAGDRLLAIDNRSLDHLNVESAFEAMQGTSNDIVTLKIEKTETDNSNLLLDSVVYSVELVRYGGPLGITIAGSEDCLEPIVLSRLTEGGLAEKTGALRVGDRLLAINFESLEHRPLSEAIRLLQSSGDRVQLKIARTLKNETSMEESRCNYSSPGLTSIDSAVHSWDSNPGENADSTVCPKDFESVLSEPLSYQETERKHDSQLQFYSDVEDIFCPSPLPLPNYNFTNTLNKYESSNYGQSRNFMDRLPDSFSHESILDNEIYHVTLYKDSVYDDYGFSVSDGLYEKGVYVNRIRKGGPADIVGLLKPYDRIVQVNDTKTQDFDCCLTVPLIASAGDRIELVIARNPFANYSLDKDRLPDALSRKSFATSQNTITKTL